MSRLVLPETAVHPAIRAKLEAKHRDIVEECQSAVAGNAVVVIGMAQNPHPKRARKALDKKGTPYKYLGYGNYFGPWRRRTALKMWTGWSTFPMIFVKGTFIGGAQELEALIASGEFDTLLGTQGQPSSAE